MADDVTIKLDTLEEAFPPKGEPPADDPQVGQYKTTDEMWQAPGVAWGSCGREKGCLIKNFTRNGRTITDIHIRLVDGRKFDRNTCSGGKAFAAAPIFSNNDTEVEFSGGRIPPDAQFWMKVPKSPKPGRGGDPVFRGWLTPVAATAEDAKPVPQDSKNIRSALRVFAGAVLFERQSRTLTFEPGHVSYLRSGQQVVGRDDGVIGCGAIVSRLSLEADDALSTNAAFSGGIFSLWNSGQDVLVASTRRFDLFSEAAPGFDSVLRGQVSLWERSLGVHSGYLDQRFGPAADDEESSLVVYTRLLGATNGLRESGRSDAFITLLSTRRAEMPRTSSARMPMVADGSRSVTAFAPDRFLGSLVRKNVTLGRAADLTDVLSRRLVRLDQTMISTDELRRIGDLAHSNPFTQAVAAILGDDEQAKF